MPTGRPNGKRVGQSSSSKVRWERSISLHLAVGQTNAADVATRADLQRSCRQPRSHLDLVPLALDPFFGLPVDDPGRRIARISDPLGLDVCRLFSSPPDLSSHPSLDNADRQTLRRHAYLALPRTSLQYIRTG